MNPLLLIAASLLMFVGIIIVLFVAFSTSWLAGGAALIACGLSLFILGNLT